MPQISNLPFRECIACDMQNHRLAKVLDHPDGSVTLDKLSKEVRDKLGGFISENTTTFAEGDIAIGTNNTAGRKAFYISGIDRVNKKIYLSTTQTIPPSFNYTETNPGWTADTSFDAPAYSVGDEFSIIWNSHYNFADKIAKIEHNVITWSGDFYPNRPESDSGEDAFTFHVPSKPHIGVVELGINAFVTGQDNKANGRGAIVGGRNNIASGNYGAVFGRNNKVGYGALVGGIGNTVTGNHSLGIGANNILKPGYSAVFGEKNTANLNKKTVVSDNVFIFGTTNTSTGSDNFIKGVGNNVSGTHNNIMGLANKVLASDNTVLGESNFVESVGNFVAGRNLTTANDDAGLSTIVGIYNEPDADARFIVGNGTDEDNRKNAMVIKKSGETIFSGSVQATKFIDANGNEYVSKKYVDEQIAALKKQLGV